jgi:hypothetical protein
MSDRQRTSIQDRVRKSFAERPECYGDQVGCHGPIHTKQTEVSDRQQRIADVENVCFELSFGLKAILVDLFEVARYFIEVFVAADYPEQPFAKAGRLIAHNLLFVVGEFGDGLPY